MSRILYYQILIIAGLVGLSFLFKGKQNALSVLTGALSYWLPTAVFAWAVSSEASARVGMRFLAVFILGESIKLFLCGALFVICMKYLPVQLISSTMGLMGAIAAFWVASAVMIFKKEFKREAVA
jgi:F0F1-type ATP synthase assembly protein I